MRVFHDPGQKLRIGHERDLSFIFHRHITALFSFIDHRIPAFLHEQQRDHRLDPCAVSVDDDSDVVFITMKGQTIRVHARDISIQGRAAMGVKVASFKKKDDTVNAIAVTGYQEEEEDPESTASEEAQVEEASETKD